jgi:hypothetical protein
VVQAFSAIRDKPLFSGINFGFELLFFQSDKLSEGCLLEDLLVFKP